MPATFTTPEFYEFAVNAADNLARLGAPARSVAQIITPLVTARGLGQLAAFEAISDGWSAGSKAAEGKPKKPFTSVRRPGLGHGSAR